MKTVGRRPRGGSGTGAEGSVLLKDKIVERVALEMAEGTWRPYKSVRELALRLGVSLVQAQKYSAEASRLLRMSWGQEDAKVAVLERIAQIGRESMARTEEVLDMAGNKHTVRKPDMKTALAAAKHLAECLGMAGTNAEVVVRYQQMSDSELLREVSRFALQQKNDPHGTIEIDGQAVPESNAHFDDAQQDALDRLDAEDARGGWRSGL